MAMRVDIPKLYALAEELENLHRDVRSLSGGAVNAANSVLSRVNGNSYPPLKDACIKAKNSAKLVDELMAGVCLKLAQQADNLRSSAQRYRAYDTIDTVN